MSIKAGRWLRVSTDQQDEDNQLARIDAYIEARGYKTVKTYRAHDMSASKREHLPLLQEAIADMKAGRLDVLVIRHTDRIDRTEDLGRILREVKEAGGRIESVTEPWLADLSGLGGKVMTSVTEFMNAEYTRKLAGNILDAQAALRAVGSYAGGVPPYGYDIIGIHADGFIHEIPGKCLSCRPDRLGRKTLRPNDKAPNAKRIFQEVKEGASQSAVCRSLLADAIPSPDGKPLWQERMIGQIIANTVYRGLVQHSGVTYLAVEPLVSAADWLGANQATAARAKKKGRGGGRPMGSLLHPVCGRCGGPLYQYGGSSYRCAGVGPMGNSAGRKGCGNTIPIALLDGEVTAEFEQYDEPEIIETVTSGKDWVEEIAQTQLAIKDLDVMADDYDDRHFALMTELRRLRALPVEQPHYWAERTGRSEGEAFTAMDPDERRAFIRLWTLTVFAPGTEPRWKLSRDR